jgi:hypothetical protein
MAKRFLLHVQLMNMVASKAEAAKSQEKVVSLALYFYIIKGE